MKPTRYGCRSAKASRSIPAARSIRDAAFTRPFAAEATACCIASSSCASRDEDFVRFPPVAADERQPEPAAAKRAVALFLREARYRSEDQVVDAGALRVLAKTVCQVAAIGSRDAIRQPTAIEEMKRRDADQFVKQQLG